jgi:hypothetical protein
MFCGQIDKNLVKSIGWGTWIRTKILGVRVRCSTVELFPTEAIEITRLFWRFYKSSRKILQIRPAAALYIVPPDKPQARPAFGGDVHLISEPHVVVDHLAAHADVV